MSDGTLDHIKNLLSNYEAKEVFVCKKNKSTFVDEF